MCAAPSPERLPWHRAHIFTPRLGRLCPPERVPRSHVCALDARRLLQSEFPLLPWAGADRQEGRSVVLDGQNEGYKSLMGTCSSGTFLEPSSQPRPHGFCSLFLQSPCERHTLGAQTFLSAAVPESHMVDPSFGGSWQNRSTGPGGPT